MSRLGTATRARAGATPAAALALGLSLTACTAGADGTDGTRSDVSSPATSGAPTGTLTVLGAASLTDVLELVAADVEADHPGVTVELSFAASSTIVQQVNEGAPADVVALAGEASLAPLEEDHRITDPVVFATNTLEIAVPPDNPAAIDDADDLAADGIRLVVCQPQVPCGAAAATFLDRLGDVPSVASYEPDVRATLGKVELGEADAGIVYRTDVAAAGDRVLGVPIPPEDNVVTAYPALAVSGSPLSQAFLDELLSGRARQHLTDAGFGTP